MLKKATMRCLALSLMILCLLGSFVTGFAINVFWEDEKAVSQDETEVVESECLMVSSGAEEFCEELESTTDEDIIESLESIPVAEKADMMKQKAETEVADVSSAELTTVLSSEELIDKGETRLYDAITSVKEYPYETTILYDTEKIAEYKSFLAAVYSHEYDIEELPVLDYYDAREEMLLARILQAEAGGTEEYFDIDEPWLRFNELIAVGSVVLSRVRSEGYDFRGVNTITEVLYQDGQYAERTINISKSDIQPGDEVLLAAKVLMRVPNILVYDSEGNWYQVGTNLVGQTGINDGYPYWGTVVFTTRWHYYTRFD